MPAARRPNHRITIKRAYEAAAASDGRRFLVDRLWPRGVKKSALSLEAWQKAVAPSDQLRQWFNHDPARWPEFQRRYFAELGGHPETWQPLLDAARSGPITLVFSARDPDHNNAAALKAYLESKG